MATISGRGRAQPPLGLYHTRAPARARVLSSVRLTPAGCDEVRHITLDLSGLSFRFWEGQSLGVLPPGVDERGRPHKLRLYSIASTRLGDDGLGTSASICVKRAHYTEPITQRVHQGVASNYLCDLRPGDEVSITGPAGKLFLLPEDPSSNLILVATGTGIAPFRAFLRHIYLEQPVWAGAVYLFFGVRTAAECLYRAEFEAFRSRPGFRLALAFSREQTTTGGLRMYVQHRMAECIDELRRLLEQNHTFLYMCGLKGMEAGIREVLVDPAQPCANALAWYETMRRGGRIMVETY